MKLKALPPSTNLGGIKVKTPDGQIGYWVSQWPKGVWLSNGNFQEGEVSLIFPIFVEDLKEALEWEITEEEPNLK